MARAGSLVLALVIVASVSIAGAAMPELLFFLIPAIIFGIGTVFVLRRGGLRLGKNGQAFAGQRPEIDIAKIKVGGGVAGLIFTVGSMWIFLAAIPALWYFLALAIAGGAGVAVALRFTKPAP